jgi:O-antigen/teichoic acid export membrane protein
MNFTRVRHYAALALGRIDPESGGQRRYIKLLQALVTAMLGKGVALLVSIIAVPLTISYLGSERYGLWMTISMMLLWLTVSDLGLSSSLTNAVSEAYAHRDQEAARRYVATAFWLLFGIVFVLAVVMVVAWPFIDWVTLLNVSSTAAKSEVGLAIGLAVFLYLINFPFTIIAKVLGAFQEGAIANYWAAGANIASLVLLLIVTRFAGGLPWLVIAMLGSVFFVNAMSAIWLFWWHKPWLRPSLVAFHRGSLQKLGRVGGMFFVVQIAALLLFQTDYLIIAHFRSPSEVTPYSLAWRLFSYSVLLQAMLVPSIWPAYAEAFALRDAFWIVRTFRLNLTVGLAITSLLVVLLVMFGQPLIRVWAGAEAVPPQALLVWMGVWSIINAAMSPIGCILSGSGHMKGQVIYATLTAVANIALSILLVRPYGATGVIIATVVAYLVFNVIPASCEAAIVLRNVRREAAGRLAAL